AAACQLDLGSVTAAGDHRTQVFAATAPPSKTVDQFVGRGAYPAGQVRLSGQMLADPNAGGPDVSGHLVLGSAMYLSRYAASWTGDEIFHSSLQRVGGGWGAFVTFDESVYLAPPPGTFFRTNEYGLRGDGVLFRWTLDTAGVWRNATSYPGFAAVKSMALISKTRTYDTFLANTRGGALYTIHIPTTSPMKPIVKVIRSSTWQGFESLVAAACGQYGVLLVGIDKDTKTGHLYAVGHANGLATVIQSRGSLPSTFDDPVYFHWTLPIDPLFGE
ncbi:MAG: hypothetical protein QOH03_2162, partial [Kribbellaceae bacterium]|nr:hypothetical protein [Kribbellaceae bacterium]